MFTAFAKHGHAKPAKGETPGKWALITVSVNQRALHEELTIKEHETKL